MAESLDPVLLSDMDAYWRAANYLSVGQMYLLANPLLREPLKPEHVKPRVSVDWGATPVQNFIYVHLNRVIKEYDLNVVYIANPGRGRPALLANVYLEGTYSELYPDIAQDEEGLRRLFRQFSCRGGIPRHLVPATAGAHDGRGRLDHPLCRAYRAGSAKPDLLFACVLGDGEAEARSLSIAWNANEIVNPATDGAVLPILLLTGDETANFTMLARSERERLRDFLHGNGHHPHFVEGADPAKMHPLMARSLDEIILEIGHIQSAARSKSLRRPLPWPVLVVCTPSGWAGPKSLEGQAVEGMFRAHQMPLPEAHSNPAQLAMLEAWLRSYRPGELFDRNGKLHSDLADLAPRGMRRMGNDSHLGGAVLGPVNELVAACEAAR
jgi:xylulose-5-phosphate/fructose-6-phosphate phosphoketolase